MVRHPNALPLTLGEKERLTSLLETVSTHTLLEALREMERQNADARLIIEVLLERAAGDEPTRIGQLPVMPR